MSAPLMTVQTPRAGPAPGPAGRSFWRELADGSAGWVVRLIVTVALGALLSAACLIGSYLLTAMFPSMFDRAYPYRANTQWGSSGVHPEDELVAWLFVIAGLLYLGAISWIWSRVLKQRRGLWYSAMATILITAVTISAAVLAEELLAGDEELVLTGIGFLGAAAVLLVWVGVWHRYGRGRPMTNEQDGLPDVRCPTCGYRMVGLYESRCPECGTAYTLEDLLGRQEFAAGRAVGGNGVAHAVVPQLMPTVAHADGLPPVPRA